MKKIKWVHGNRSPRAHRAPRVSGVALAYHSSSCIRVSGLPTSLTGQARLGIHAVKIEALDFCAARFGASICLPFVFEGNPGSIILARKRGRCL
jgi:hypothetical protein